MSKVFACVFTGLLVVVGMMGCGGASDVKFDATSSATSAKSIGAITSGMTEDQKQVFVARDLAFSQLIQVKAGTPSTSIDTEGDSWNDPIPDRGRGERTAADKS